MTDKTTDKLFYQVQKDLWRAEGYFSPNTGEPVRLTLAEKAVYMHMEDRIAYFVEKMEGEYFETHETIAESVNIERKACGKIVRKFIEEGVIKAVKKKPRMGGQLQWFYASIDKDLKLWVGSKELPIVLDTRRRVHDQSTKTVYIPDLDDEEGAPF